MHKNCEESRQKVRIRWEKDKQLVEMSMVCVQMSPAVWPRFNADELRRTSGTLTDVSLTHVYTFPHKYSHV